MTNRPTGTVKTTIEKRIIMRLVRAACAARVAAYAPYSKFRVGAAVLTAGGTIHGGCNVENASYGATVCAERVAALSAIAAGARQICAVAVVYDDHALAIPCGLCRQVLSEFGPAMLVIQANARGEYTLTSLATLLPAPFVKLPVPAATKKPRRKS